MEVYAEPCPGSCLSVLTALLFSFLSPAHGAQEISLLLVSRVSLLCGLLLSGGVALESSLLPLSCLESPFVDRELHKWLFSSVPSLREACRAVPMCQSLRLPHGPALAPVLPRLSISGVRALLEGFLSSLEADEEVLAHTEAGSRGCPLTLLLHNQGTEWLSPVLWGGN